MGFFFHTVFAFWAALTIAHAQPPKQSQIEDLNLADHSNLYPKIEYEKLTEIKMKCRAGGPELMGTKNCKELKKQIKALAKSRVQTMSQDYYYGRSVTDWVTGEAKEVQRPVCNITAGEKSKNLFGEDCGPMCKVKIRTGLGSGDGELTGPCVKEAAHSRGAYVQILNFFAEKVFEELKKGTIQLADYDGRRPSAPMAADTIRMQEGFETVMNEFVITAGLEKVASLKCVDSVDRATAIAPCRMQAGQNYIASQWAMFLAHEISVRTTKEFYEQWPKILGSVAGCIASKCSDSVSCSTCSDSERSRKATRCYQNHFDRCLIPLLDKYKTKEEIKILVENSKVGAQK